MCIAGRTAIAVQVGMKICRVLVRSISREKSIGEVESASTEQTAMRTKWFKHIAI